MYYTDYLSIMIRDEAMHDRRIIIVDVNFNCVQGQMNDTQKLYLLDCNSF